MNIDLNSIVGAAGMLIAGCITAATPGLMAWIRAKTHSETLTQAAKVGGDTAYAALVAATQAATAKGGTLDYQAAERAAVAAGIQAVQSVGVTVPAVRDLAEAAVKTAVVQGLGSKLAKDPTVSAIGAAVATATGPAASASAGQGAPAG